MPRIEKCVTAGNMNEKYTMSQALQVTADELGKLKIMIADISTSPGQEPSAMANEIVLMWSATTL